MLLELIEVQILVKRSPSLLNNLSLMKYALVDANYGCTLLLCMLHLLLDLQKHLIVFLLEVHLVRSPPTPANFDLLVANFVSRVELS